MSTESLENAIVRETSTTFQLNSYQQDRQAVVRLVEQASSELNIYSHLLCPAIFNTLAVVDACKTFCLKHHRTKINILLNDSQAITKISHRLLGLSHKLSSSIFFKTIADDIPTRDDDFVCIDKSAYFQLPNHQHYNGLCNFSDAAHNAQFLSFFNDAWARSETAPDLRSALL